MKKPKSKLHRFGRDLLEGLLDALSNLLDETEEEDDKTTHGVWSALKQIEANTSKAEAIWTQLRAELQQRAQVPREFGTVLILWKDAEGAPRCLSRTVRFSMPPGTEHSVEIQGVYRLPAGTWIVAINCDLRAAYVGTDSIDMGPAPRGRLVVTSNPIEMSSLLRLIVVAGK